MLFIVFGMMNSVFCPLFEVLTILFFSVLVGIDVLCYLCSFSGTDVVIKCIAGGFVSLVIVIFQ